MHRDVLKLFRESESVLIRNGVGVESEKPTSWNNLKNKNLECPTLPKKIIEILLIAISQFSQYYNTLCDMINNIL